MAYTGGPLNELNGKMGISAPNRSVPVMKLIKTHQPKSKDELVELIRHHHENDCACGIKSHGTVTDFGRKLYEAQLKYWGKYRFTLQQCIQWEYDLFVVQSLKGGIIEKRAIRELARLLPEYDVTEAAGYLDEELRIDILLQKNGETRAGIQVKPVTFTHMRAEVITFNRTANQKWNHPVFYLYYDENEEFESISELINQLRNQT